MIHVHMGYGIWDMYMGYGIYGIVDRAKAKHNAQ
jgi:hypothetical protein